MNFQDGLEIGFFSSVILVAISHGLLLAAIFLFNRRLNAISNRFLAMAILGRYMEPCLTG